MNVNLDDDDFDQKMAALNGNQSEVLSLATGALSTAQSDRPALRLGAFHGLPGEVVRTIDPHTEADPAAILLSYLLALGNVVGRNPHFTVEATKHHLNLFAVLVGDTAKARKGTSWDHIKRIFALVESKDGDAERSTWHSRTLSSLSSGEGLIWAVRDADMLGDFADPGVNDKRCIVTDSEFAQTLGKLSRRGNTLSPVLRNSWDSGDLRIATKNSPARATGAHVSIIGHITREELKRQLTTTEVANGFANRFLWVAVHRSKMLPDGGNLKENDLREIIERTREVVGEANGFGRITRDADARELWHAVYPDLSDGQHGLFGAVTARAEAQVVRLSCLYALADFSREVKVEHLRAALAVWEYCAASAAFVFGPDSGDPIADRLHGALRRAGASGMTRTEIRDFFARNMKTSEIDAALELLQSKKLAKSKRDARTETWFAAHVGNDIRLTTQGLPARDDGEVVTVGSTGSEHSDRPSMPIDSSE
jgi:hypothetical protein